jgi:2,4-dienoyl-CoA reductase-like NADH-dependent reductase (Old Yellow Enzyme family)
MSTRTQKLFSPLQLGAVNLSHRVVMAPLTRQRSEQPGDIPNPLMIEYLQSLSSSSALSSSICDRRLEGRGTFRMEDTEGAEVLGVDPKSRSVSFTATWRVDRCLL